MPNYFGTSPWRDAAEYGRGFGDTITEALLQMPQQRAQMAMQAQQLGLQQKFELARLAEQQRQNQAENQLGQQELTLKQQEAQHANEFHQAELENQKIKNANEARGTWKMVVPSDGGPSYKINTATGEHQWVTDAPKTGFGGGGFLKPAEQDATINALTRLTQGFGAGAFSANGTPEQQAASYNLYTNTIPKILPFLTGRLQQMQGLGGGGQTNSPAVGLPVAAPVGLTNQPGLTPPPKVFRYDPQSGSLTQ